MKQSSHVVWTRINERACFRELQNRDDYQSKIMIASSKHLSIIYTFVLAIPIRPHRSPTPTHVAAVPLTPKFRPDSRRRSYRHDLDATKAECRRLLVVIRTTAPAPRKLLLPSESTSLLVSNSNSDGSRECEPNLWNVTHRLSSTHFRQSSRALFMRTVR